MDRRIFLVVVLTAIVIVVTPLLFPSVKNPPVGDSVVVGAVHATAQGGNQADEVLGKAVATTKENSQKTAPLIDGEGNQRGVGDTLTIKSAHMSVLYSSRYGAPLQVALADYASRTPGSPAGPVRLESVVDQPLVKYDLVLEDTVVEVSRGNLSGKLVSRVDASGVKFEGIAQGHAISIEYGNPKRNDNRYLIHVVLEVQNAPEGGQLVVDLPTTLESAESDTTDDIRHLAFGYKAVAGSVESLPFAKLDSGETKRAIGPLEWVAVRNKYFLVAILAPDSSITSARFTGVGRVAKLAPDAVGAIMLPLHNGRVSFDLYTGPQEFDQLRALGHDMDHVNPYAGWLHGVVQPFATIVTRVLLWMKRTSGLSYGWVIIIFGVSVRLLLWPLNQSAMRTSIRMQRLQPELTEVQRRYKNDPERQREALVKLYQAHGMTPFSPMMGCLPMLLPMPILFALYFVFLNTIEFRGVSFLWMHDISAADPYYITPLIMGLSMFALSWIGMRGTPPTAQTRMMSYMMPVVLTFMFFRFAAGLNLYYAVQNLAALPQQWLLARERAGLGKSGRIGGPPMDGIRKGGQERDTL